MADDDEPANFASPACFLHEIDPAYSGLPGPLDQQTWTHVNRWRKAERERLIAGRLALPAATRLQADQDRRLEVQGEGSGTMSALPLLPPVAAHRDDDLRRDALRRLQRHEVAGRQPNLIIRHEPTGTNNRQRQVGAAHVPGAGARQL